MSSSKLSSIVPHSDYVLKLGGYVRSHDAMGGPRLDTLLIGLTGGDTVRIGLVHT